MFLEQVATGKLDLAYAHDYMADGGDQKSGWTGSWGPIIEMFQNVHRGTNEFGFANFAVASRGAMEWEPWGLLAPGDTFVEHDDVGFRMIHLDPSHTFVAGS